MANPGDLTPFHDLTDDELADGICTWAGRVAAGEAELLSLVAEFDRREAWGGPGLLSCAHWLTWRIGLSPGAAREKVRVARRLEELPRVREAFAAGLVSYSQARALTRAACPEDQQLWIDLARHSTAGQLERLVRGVRRARSSAEAVRDPELAVWRVRARKRYDDDGNAVYTIVLPAQEAAMLDAALEAVRERLDHTAGVVAKDAQRPSDAPEVPQPSADQAQDVPAATPPTAVPSPIAPVSLADRPAAGVPAETPPGCLPDPSTAEMPAGTPVAPMLDRAAAGVPAETPVAAYADRPGAGVRAGTPRASLANALLALAREGLERRASEQPSAARRSRSALVAQADPLSGWARLRDGELLPPASLPPALRLLTRQDVRPLAREELRRHDLGRTRRLPTLALRELLGTLDGERCRFPGCSRHRKLHAHHVVPWQDGGSTDLGNLVLLCGRHHTIVHAQRFALVLQQDRRLSVRTVTGVPVLHHPALPWASAAELDPKHRISAQTLPPAGVDARLDLGYAVMVLAQQAA